MASISFTSEPPSAVTMISASKSVGKAMSMSEPRMMSISTRPPVTPATMPSGTPRAKANATETSPTSSETRAPQMMRLSRSRPNSSVPKRCRSTAPGPFSTASENWADGLSGAIRGAAAAITIMAAAIASPIAIGSQRRSRPRPAARDSSAVVGRARSAESARRTSAMSLPPGLPVGDPRIDDGVEHVDHQVDQDDRHREHGDGALGQRVVAGADRVDQHLAEPGPGEDGLGGHGSVERDRHEDADDRQQRDHHVAERVLVDDQALVLALGARGADVVLADHLEHRRARQAAHRRREREAQREGRQGQVMQHVGDGGEEVPRLREDLARPDHGEHAVQIAAADQREEIEAKRERDEQQDPEPEHRHGEAQERQDPQRVVDERIAALERRDDTDRDADERGDDRAGHDQDERVREHARDVVAYRIALAERVAEVEFDRAPEIIRVLHRERPVQPED